MGKSKDRRKWSQNEKDSIKWLWGFERASKVLSEHSQVVVVGDRDSDLFSLFSASRSENVELLICAFLNRALDDSEAPHLKEALAAVG